MIIKIDNYSLLLFSGKQTPTYENNCRELIKLVNDFLCQSTDNNERITENLVNGISLFLNCNKINQFFCLCSLKGIISILDTMLIFNKNDTANANQSLSVYASHDDHWSETSLTALNILLIFLAHSNVSFCGSASVRIHSLLNCRPLNGREEAAYLLSKVNDIFSSIPHVEDSEHYTFLLPLMRIIMEKSFDLLQMNVSIPNIPLCREILTTLDDFRQCISAIDREDWQMFIQQITEPYADHYCSMSVQTISDEYENLVE